VVDGTTWHRIVKTIHRTFDDESIEITPATTARDVPDWDSVSNVELMVALEAEFGVRFYTGQIAAMKDVGELATTIEQQLRNGRR
jgi:acyl carrier protein